MKTYWISFAAGKNLGACIVEAFTPEMALHKVNILNINPGGEAMISAFVDTEDAQEEIALWGKNVLIPPEALKRQGYKSTNDLTEKEKEILYSHKDTAFVCQKCNEGNCKCS